MFSKLFFVILPQKSPNKPRTSLFFENITQIKYLRKLAHAMRLAGNAAIMPLIMRRVSLCHQRYRLPHSLFFTLFPT